MTFRLRALEDLVEELGTQAKATALLKEAGAALVHGMFDQGALDAFNSEPKTTNVGKSSKSAFTIAPTDGVGAFKAVLDPLELDIVRHLYLRSNFLTVRNAKRQRAQLKVYCISSGHPRTGNASFTLNGFLREDAPQYFMLIVFDQVRAWVMSKQQAQLLHKATVKAGGKTDTATVKKADLDDLNGRMRVTLGMESDYLLTSAKQLGL